MSLSRIGISNTYNANVRIGNWAEESELSRAKIAEYLQRKAAGTLVSQQIDNTRELCLTEVGLTYSTDGALHIGDTVVLFSHKTFGVVSVDPFETSAAGFNAFAVTTSTVTKGHVARNCFIIEAYDNNVRSGTPLLYGQLFRLRLHPTLRSGRPFYLHSQPAVSGITSRISRRNPVCMTDGANSFDSVWKAVARNVDIRFEADGTPVQTHTPLVILHAATHQALSSDVQYRSGNDFGMEYELCAHTALSVGKARGLHSEREGRTTVEQPKRVESDTNVFAFLTAASAEGERALHKSDADRRAEDDAVRQITALISNDITRTGPNTLYSIALNLRRADTKNADLIARDLFINVIQSLDIGYNVTDSQWTTLARYYDCRHDGTVEYAQFISALRNGNMSSARRRRVNTVFDQLDTFGADRIDTLALIELVNVDDRIEYAQRWGVFAAVTRIEFVDWFECLSHFVADDNQFYRIMDTTFNGIKPREEEKEQ